MLHDSEEIQTNSIGGKQSKLYVAYHLIDPLALRALAATHHRGGVKYDIDNWRKIEVEEHLNHAMHHINQAMIRYTQMRLSSELKLNSTPPIWLEDDLAHALCCITFALAKEIEVYGLHSEHSDPFYHEPKTSPCEPPNIRDNGRDVPDFSATEVVDSRPRHTTAPPSPTRRDDSERSSPMVGGEKSWLGKSPMPSDRRRR